MANEFKVRKGLVVNGSGSVILDVQGSQGQLFSVTDQLSGSLFSVNDISGVPVLEAFSDSTVKIGQYLSEAIIVSGSTARITGSIAMAGFSSGSVLFAGPGGSISQNNASFFWDNVNGRLGIGTNAPDNTLTVQLPMGVNNGGLGFNVKKGTGYFLACNGSSGTNSFSPFFIGVPNVDANALGFQGNLFNTTSTNPAILFTSVNLSGANAIQNSQITLGINNGANRLLNLYGNGNLLLQNGGTFTDSGERLQVSGSAKITDGLVVTGSATILSTLTATGGSVSLASVGGSVTFINGYNNQIVANRFHLYSTGTNIRGINAGNQGWILSKSTGAGDLYPSSIFAIDSTTQGFLVPRMAASQRTAIASPNQGLLVYDTDSATEGLWMYNSGSTPGWQEVLTNSGSQSISGSITANDITVTGTLTAQTIVAQTITSSILYSSGSNIFGNSLSNTQDFTGSVRITGSLSLPYLSTGSVLFVGADRSISQNNSSLFWDSANGRLGIGTNVPAYKLDITGNVRVSSGGTNINGLLQFFGVTGNFYHDIQGGDYAGHPDVTRIRLGNSGTHWQGVMSFWTKDANTTTITERMRINELGSVGIGTTSPSFRLDVSGSSRFIGNMTITGSANITQALTASATIISGSGTQRLTIVGSGSAQPLFTVQGSQGELFSIVDSLSGSLFSVNDQSGLPIMEVFSDNTILMGNYLDPMLLTTTKTGSAAGINTIYSLPTSSYDAVYIDYTIRSGSNARAGNFMAMWSGTSVNFTDNSITEFGTTSGFIFGAHVSGSNMVVTGSSPTSGWTVKTIIKAI